MEPARRLIWGSRFPKPKGSQRRIIAGSDGTQRLDIGCGQAACESVLLRLGIVTWAPCRPKGQDVTV